MGSSEIEGTAGISHPLPPLSQQSLSTRHCDGATTQPNLRCRALRQSFLLERRSPRLESGILVMSFASRT